MAKEELTIQFESKARIIVGADIDPYLKSHASLEHLIPLVPKDFDVEKNSDSVVALGNSCIINKVNKNGHVVDSKGALLIAKSAKYKLVNIEHQKSKVVGVVAAADFYDFQGNIMTEEEVLKTDTPFYLSLCTIIAKDTMPTLAARLQESSDLATDDIISFSWELKFKEYYLISGSKMISEAEVIDEEEEVLKLKGRLSIFKGNNTMPDNKTPLYLVASGDDLIFSGVALTLAPACENTNVAIVDIEDLTEETNESEASLNPVLEIAAANENILNINENNTSQNKNTNVIETMEKKTKIEKIEEIIDADLINIEASAITSFITQKLTEADDKYKEIVSSKEKETELAAAKTKELEASVNETKEALAKVTKELEGIKEISAAKEKEDLFNARMGDLDSKYELDTEKRSIVAKQIKELDRDQYEAWAGDFSKLNDKMLKEVKASVTETKDKEVEISASELLEKGKKIEAAIPNVQTTQVDAMEKYKLAFSPENFEVSVGRKRITK